MEVIPATLFGRPDWATLRDEVACPLCQYNLRGLITRFVAEDPNWQDGIEFKPLKKLGCVTTMSSVAFLSVAAGIIILLRHR